MGWGGGGGEPAFGNSCEDLLPPTFSLLEFEVLLIQFTSVLQAGPSLTICRDVLPVGALLAQNTEREQRRANQSHALIGHSGHKLCKSLSFAIV